MNLIIKESIIKRLISVAENHANTKIKLQYCWVLSFFFTAYYQCAKMSFDYYEPISSLLCKIMMDNLITIKPLFYKCCWFLAGPYRTYLIIEHRVYEKILEVDVQADKDYL